MYKAVLPHNLNNLFTLFNVSNTTYISILSILKLKRTTPLKTLGVLWHYQAKGYQFHEMFYSFKLFESTDSLYVKYRYFSSLQRYERKIQHVTF